MIAPSVMFIEMAADSLAQRKVDEISEATLKELKAFGDGRARKVGASGITQDFQQGYVLGLEVARVLLRGNPAAVQAGITL